MPVVGEQFQKEKKNQDIKVVRHETEQTHRTETEIEGGMISSTLNHVKILT